MDEETTQDRKDELSAMEQQLRLDGQKLDTLWNQARMATGQKRTDLHKEMGPLREKHRVDRNEHNAMKKDDTLVSRDSKIKSGEATAEENTTEDNSVAPKK